ncbi:alpha/beta hydrolase [Aquaticitalea lipolytica]|uniref:Alpha/beta hydrolase n=1 Tax=Aquaticitalea lipolytica TaxID=1247562 RepID=A0A8J2TUC4_9FLAO|nr:alpha/beta hydrolase [Aquaticitalea lipolytica]GFZ93815.1 alpha/beta hydrolase [Aquaticitalea lipolytica]
MKKKYFILLPFLLCFLYLSAQNLELKHIDFIDKKGNKIDAEFGQFYVLENRGGLSESKKLKISFVRFKSTNPRPKSPIVYLAGGPGGSGIETAKGERFSLFMKLRETSDVILLDQRGVGQSNILSKCPYYAEFSQYNAIEKQEYLSKTISNIQKCVDFWKSEGQDLEAYNTSENANDIDDLRKILGVDKISLIGISYGSHLAIEYIKRFEKNLDKVVLASIEGPDETIKYPKDTEKFVNKICFLAKDNYGFLPKYPDLKNKILKVHEALNKQFKVIPFTNKEGIKDSVAISNFELQGIITNFYLKNPEEQRKLPALYTKMYNEDFSDIVQYAILVKKYARTINPMSFSMDMSSHISDERNLKISKQISESIYGTSLNFLYYEWMNSIDFKHLPDSFRKLEPNSVNTLLLSGDLDGRTYVSSAKKIAKKFKNGKHIIIENGGHDSFLTSETVGRLVSDFFKNIKTDDRKIKLPTIPFI